MEAGNMALRICTEILPPGINVCCCRKNQVYCKNFGMLDSKDGVRKEQNLNIVFLQLPLLLSTSLSIPVLKSGT